MDQVKKLRGSYNLSRKDLADILGTSLKHIVSIEKGSADLTHKQVGILCDRFDLDENFFKSKDQLEDPQNIDEWNSVIGRNVKYFRELNGMTQQILAEELGYAGPASISGVERGIKPMGKKALLKLADLFQIHISELFNPNDPSMTDTKNKLVGRFTYVVNSKRKPESWEAFVAAVNRAYSELTAERPD